jgi:hypothetical protein
MQFGVNVVVSHRGCHDVSICFFFLRKRRYKEARQLAQKYEYYEKQKQHECKSSTNDSKVFKRTQVMIMPFCEYFDDFESFESVMQAIHQARKNALDLITDLSIEKLEKKNKSMQIMDEEWRYVSFLYFISCIDFHVPKWRN